MKKQGWTAYAVVGGLCAFVLWALLRGNGSPTESPDAGAAVASSSSAPPADDGLRIEDLVVGTGWEATKGDKVKVHYVGTLTNGSEFDSSRKNDAPLDFQIGEGQVIRGWDQGIPGMKIGGKRKLRVPPDFAYGAKGSPPVIPPNATLIFEVELLEVTKSTSPAENTSPVRDQ